MNENEFSPEWKSNGVETTAVTRPASPVQKEIVIPVIMEEEALRDEVRIGASSALFHEEAEPATAVAPPAPSPPAPDTPFDPWQSLIRLVVGGALEGSAELAQRLELLEAYLREEITDQDAPDAATQKDLLRYALVGLSFEGPEKVRRGVNRLWHAQKQLAQTAVRTTRPLANSRLLNPLHRRLDQATARGQAEIVRWIERGQLEEPVSRELARLAFTEVVDEFIEHLAENQEVQALVQQQSVGLATEMVGQVRQRTFTADTLVERIARAVTRRTPRLEPPAADLSDFQELP